MSLAGQLSDGLPQFQTRQALLVLDLQNDFVSTNSRLPVSQPSGLLERITTLVPAFRGTGDVIWIRSEFAAPRTVNDSSGEGDNIITDQQLPEALRQPKSSSSEASEEQTFAQPPPSGRSQRAMDLFKRMAARHGDMDEEEADKTTQDERDPVPQTSQVEDVEAFLSPSASSPEPSCCLPNSFGARLADSVVPLVDELKDGVFTKTHYSAFNDTNLLALLRGNLVTELYICGLISNISVYATALDAARHGFSIIIVDDCLGYRNKVRHDEALKQMMDYMGAESMPSAELLTFLQTDTGKKPPAAGSTSTVGDAMGYAELVELVEGISLRNAAMGVTRTDSGVSNVSPMTSEADLGAKPERKIERTPLSAPSDDHIQIETPKFDEGRTSSKDSGFQSVDASLEDRAKATELSDSKPRQISTGFADTIAPEYLSTTLHPDASTSPSSVDAPQRPAGYVARPVARKIRQRKRPSNDQATISTARDEIGEGDSRVMHQFIPSPLIDGMFERVKQEVQWRTMYHRGGQVPRLVAVEGQVGEDESIPIYRHPSDESPPLSPFCPAVSLIRDEVEKVLQHPVNHVLIQRYRDGQDYISEHSDKTLDIVRGSNIVNVSLGAQRAMTLRTKKSAAASIADTPAEKSGHGSNSVPLVSQLDAGRGTVPPVEAKSSSRQTQRISLSHNSMFVLGQKTNMRWLHGIRQDKRDHSERTQEELAFGGERISLTFRHIGTFLDKSSGLIWGQGAKAKTREDAHKVCSGASREAEAMIIAFGSENQQSDFDWDAAYGRGFDTVDAVAPLPRLFLSGHHVSDLRVKLILAEAGVNWELGPPTSANVGQLGMGPEFSSMRFIDNDAEKTEVEGTLPILLYLETYYRQRGAFGSNYTRGEMGRVLTRTGLSNDLNGLWYDRWRAPDGRQGDESLRRILEQFEAFGSTSTFIAGDGYTLADCTFWPLLAAITTDWPGWDQAVFPALHRYYEQVFSRPSVQHVLKDHPDQKGKDRIIQG